MVARMMMALLILLLAGCGGGGGADIAETAVPSAGGAPGTVQLKSTAATVVESAGTVSIAVARTGGSFGAISVSVSTEAVTAAAGQDFTATSTTVQFADGDSADKIVAIPLVDDAITEGAETFKVNMVSAANANPTAVTVTIVDDDPPGTLQLSSATYSVGEAGGSIAINVTRTGGIAGPASVSLTTRDGSALATQDYDAATASLSFGAGDSAPKTATIPIINDALAEADETFEIVLSDASGATLGTVTSAIVTIPANDQPPPPPAGGLPGSLQLTSASYSVSESGGNLIVTVTRIGGSSGAVAATLTATSGTALAGSDYTGTTFNVSFASGDASSRIVSIPIVNDTTAELAESFAVTLSAPTGGATLGAPTVATASIQDNDPPNAPAVTLDVATKRLDLSWNAVPTALTYKVYLNPDGASGFTQVGANIAAPATSASIDVAVHNFNWAAALIRVEACNDTSCSGSPALSASSAMLDAMGYFKAASIDPSDALGTSVAVSGDGAIVVVGVPGEDSNAANINGVATNNGLANSGAVYVFGRTGGQWVQTAYIKSIAPAASNSFGTAVAISADGSTIAVGEPGRDSNQGAVHLFGPDGATWQRLITLSSLAEPGDRAGAALALSANGSAIAIGMPGEDGDGDSSPDSGAVRTYRRTNSLTWVTGTAYFHKASNPQAGDLFGSAVALSAAGTTLAIGAIGEASASTTIGGDQNSNSAPGAGAVYIFTGSGDAVFTFSTYIKAGNAEPLDNFGAAVALSADGNTLAVGAPLEDGAATGAQFPIPAPPDVPPPSGSPPPGAPNPLPTTFQGLCAAPVLRPAVGCESGAVYIFVRDAGTWSAQSYIKGSNNQYEDRFGTSVSLSGDGNTVAIGSPSEDSSADGIEGNETLEDEPESGAAYLYVRNGAAWAQRSYIKASNSGADDAFGTSVSLSSDATALAVGAPGEKSGSGTNQNDDSATTAGAAYLY